MGNLNKQVRFNYFIIISRPVAGRLLFSAWPPAPSRAAGVCSASFPVLLPKAFGRRPPERRGLLCGRGRKTGTQYTDLSPKSGCEELYPGVLVSRGYPLPWCPGGPPRGTDNRWTTYDSVCVYAYLLYTPFFPLSREIDQNALFFFLDVRPDTFPHNTEAFSTNAFCES